MFEQYTQDGKLLIRKVLPYQLYDMTGLARWFEEMSSQGLILDHFGIRSAIFYQDKPAPGVRYRLEPHTASWDNSLDYDRNEAYAQSGWEYVTNIDPYYYVYRANDPEAEELHTDPITQGYVFERYIRNHVRSFFIGYGILFFPTLAAIFSGLAGRMEARRIAEFIVQLAEHPASALSTLLAAAWGGLILAPICWFRFFRLWKLRHQLSQGIPLDENTRHPRSPARTYFYWGVPIALEVISFFSIFFPLPQNLTLSPSDPAPAPLISLYDVQLDPAVHDPLYVTHEFYVTSSPLASITTLWQSAEPDGSPEGPDAYLRIRCAQLQVPAMAPWVCKGWLFEQEDTNRRQMTEWSLPGADLLYRDATPPQAPSQEEKPSLFCCGQVDSWAFTFYICGVTDPEACFRQFIQRMDSSPA